MAKYPDTYIFSSFFYTKLSVAGYQGVSNWKRPNCLFKKRLLIFPVHSGSHWCLIAVDIHKRVVSLYDSLGNGNAFLMNAVEQFLMMEALNKKVNADSWTKGHGRSLQQDNFNDCGVFVCINAQLLSAQATPKLPLDIPNTRRKIKFELLNSKLL